MGAPVSRPEAATQPKAESLLNAFENMDAAERRKHASVLTYWLSIRGDKDFPPIRDLDPLELSDAAPHSLLLELVGGGEDAEIRHLGEELKPHGGVAKLSEAGRPSLLSAIGAKLGIVAISRNFLAFEDEFEVAGQAHRACITLLPFGSTGAWVDYVYGYVTIEAATAEGGAQVAAEPGQDGSETAEIVAEAGEPTFEPDSEPGQATVEEMAAEHFEGAPASTPEDEPEAAAELQIEVEPEPEPEAEPQPSARPGFSKLLEAITGFHGTSVKVEPKLPTPPPLDELGEYAVGPEPAAPETQPETADGPVEPAEDAEAIEDQPVCEEPAAEAQAIQPTASSEGTLESKLAEVRAKADEARQARLRSEQALYEGVGAAYDFALDAETSPEEYLRLVEAQGMKIQLRSPMAPVARLAFNGLCDDSTVGEVAKVLAWALKEELPRGTLTERIQNAGGLAPLLSEVRA